MKKYLLVFNLFFSLFLTAQNEEATIPTWVMDNWTSHVAGTGKWITSNQTYQNEQEPYDAYGMHWERGLGKKSIKGRLYCINDGKEVGNVWEFLNFWDSDTKQQRMIQIGATGFVGARCI